MHPYYVVVFVWRKPKLFLQVRNDFTPINKTTEKNGDFWTDLDPAEQKKGLARAWKKHKSNEF